MDDSLLDTDILNEVLKQKNPSVIRHASDYFNWHKSFVISSMTRYEVRRGLLEKNATTQLDQFQVFCQNSVILPVTDLILDHAAELWAIGRSRGLAPNDADLIIAATAILHKKILVTGNTAHFVWIAELQLRNWRDP